MVFFMESVGTSLSPRRKLELDIASNQAKEIQGILCLIQKHITLDPINYT